MSEKLLDLRASLLQILDEAIKVDGAVKGNVQLFDKSVDGLRIVAQRGFDSSFMQLFEVVREDELCPCGRALRHQRRVVSPDVSSDRLYSPYLLTAQSNGYQAVQSTPIIGKDGQLKGVFSTHFEKVHHLSEKASRALDDCASKMAQLIAENEAELARS